MLAVVVTDVEVEGEWQFARRQFGATPSQLRLMTEWFVEHEVEDVVMESTAQVGLAGSEISRMPSAW